jgi:hypothetical protein
MSQVLLLMLIDIEKYFPFQLLLVII